MSEMAAVYMLILVFAGGGNLPRDLASVLEPEDYFRSRQIVVKVADLVQVAEQEPRDGKAQIAQVQALRWLGEHADQVKKDSQATEALRQIATGKKAQDPVGFARDYAQQALALVEEKPAPKPTPLPSDSVRSDAFQWFPSHATFVAAADLRPAGQVQGLNERAFISRLLKMMPPRGREEMYKFADSVGNLRLDRMSFAYAPNPVEKHKGRIYMRFTGLGDRKGLAEFIKSNLHDATLEYRKGPKGEIITVLNSSKNPPAFAFIGDTDLIMAGYDGGGDAQSIEVLDEVLDVRAGKKPNVTAGPLADQLKKVPALASALALGDVPEEVRRDLTRGGPFKVAPRSIAATVTREKTVDIRLHATLADEAEAKAFAESVEGLKQMAAAGLKAIPPQMKIKPASVDLLAKTLDGIKIEPKDSTVTGGVEISAEALAAAQEMMEKAMGFYMEKDKAVPAPPPPLPKAKETAPPAR